MHAVRCQVVLPEFNPGSRAGLVLQGLVQAAQFAQQGILIAVGTQTGTIAANASKKLTIAQHNARDPHQLQRLPLRLRGGIAGRG